MRRYRKPHRIKRKKSIIKNRFFLLGFLIFVFLVFAIYFLFFSDFFQIEKITVFGNKKILKEEIIKIAENELKKKKIFSAGKNIFLANLGGIEKDILSDFPQIAEAEISRSLPRTLIFTILERKAVAKFCKDYKLFTKDKTESSYQKCFPLDKEGIIFEEIGGNNLSLPKIKNPDSKDELELGQRIIETDLLFGILDIFSDLENLNIQTKEFLIVSEERTNVEALDNWEIYFNPKKDLAWQLTKLKAVLEEDIPLEKRKDLEYIELRFGNSAPFKYRQAKE
ncbi:MAG: cell division protein FtsQ/DivIB [Candidatus Nealsonbacteria bacterium]